MAHEEDIPMHSLKVKNKSLKSKKLMRVSSMLNIGNSRSKKDFNSKTLEIQKRYQLKKWLGEGKQGKVYLAFDTETNQKVAIKIINDDVEEQERFKSEVIILKLIQKLGPDK